MDQIQINDLVHSFVTRKRWEARLMAVEISKLFSKPTEEPKPAPVATGDDFLKMLGAKIKHVNPVG